VTLNKGERLGRACGRSTRLASIKEKTSPQLAARPLWTGLDRPVLESVDDRLRPTKQSLSRRQRRRLQLVPSERLEGAADPARIRLNARRSRLR